MPCRPVGTPACCPRPPRRCGNARRSQSAAAPYRRPPRCVPASAHTSGHGTQAGKHAGRNGQESREKWGAPGLKGVQGRVHEERQTASYPSCIPSVNIPATAHPTFGLMSYTFATRMPRQRCRRQAASAATAARAVGTQAYGDATSAVACCRYQPPAHSLGTCQTRVENVAQHRAAGRNGAPSADEKRCFTISARPCKL